MSYKLKNLSLNKQSRLSILPSGIKSYISNTTSRRVNRQEAIKLSSIIDWTQKNHEAMRLNVFHFAYLKDFGVYPANRLMVLRRFNGPVPDDIFSCLKKLKSTKDYNINKIPNKILNMNKKDIKSLNKKHKIIKKNKKNNELQNIYFKFL
jgi:hypothetical protein